MTSIGHNSAGVDVSGIAGDKVCSFVRRILNLDEEIAALNADKSEVYKEAKGMGFDVPALRVIIQEQKKQEKDPAKFQETTAIVDLYRDAVRRGMPVATRARTSGEE